MCTSQNTNTYYGLSAQEYFGLLETAQNGNTAERLAASTRLQDLHDNYVAPAYEHNPDPLPRIVGNMQNRMNTLTGSRLGTSALRIPTQTINEGGPNGTNLPRTNN